MPIFVPKYNLFCELFCVENLFFYSVSMLKSVYSILLMSKAILSIGEWSYQNFPFSRYVTDDLFYRAITAEIRHESCAVPNLNVRWAYLI